MRMPADGPTDRERYSSGYYTPVPNVTLYPVKRHNGAKNKSYSGKEYNYQGLVLFGEYLNSLGINDFLVNTSEIYGTTESAVELIEKYIGTIGGKMIDYNQDKSGVLYECLTKSKKMDNSEVKL